MPNIKRHKEGLRHISFRISDRHRFALRVIARTSRQSDSVALESAIEALADALPLPRSWSDLWDPEESVRLLNLWSLPQYKPATDEVDRHAFVLAHPQFFWADAARRTPHRARSVVLWPHLDDLAELWRTSKHEDYHAASKEMTKWLKKAKIDPPNA